MRIRSRLLLLVLAVLVPSFLAAALGIGYVYTEAQKSHRRSMREITRALALVLDKEINQREAILRTLAASPALDAGDLETFYKQALRIAPLGDTSVFLSDPSGQQILNTRLPFGTTGLPRSPVEELRKRYGPEATILSNLYFAPIGKDNSFSVQIPVKRDNRILYYVALGSFSSHLQSVFEAQRLPVAWSGVIVDRNGVVVARNNEPERYVGKHVGEERFKALDARTEGFHHSVTLAGEPVVSFFSRAPDSGWSFIVAVPQREFRHIAIRAATITGGISLLLLGLAVIAAYIVGRNTTRTIEALRLSAERLGRGEPVTAHRSGILEMDAVSAAMRQASDEIQAGKSALEGRIAEAVAVAERSQRALLQGQKLEALGRLTGGIAHDFNNVLQTLTTGLEVAHFSSADARVTSPLEACQRAVARASQLTGQLLAFARVQDARLETVDLSRQMAAMTSLLTGAVRSDIDFQLDVADTLWPVTLDPLQFELALLNLTINARDAMPQGGMLKIDARNEILTDRVDELVAGEYVRLSVIDTGEGMSQDVLAKAFDPFFTTKSVGKGSGMGLAQAYGFAKQSGGTLILRSQSGQGTAAILYLPKAERPVQPAPPDAAVRPRTASGQKILFVEDDALVSDVVPAALEAAGFTVVLAKNGEEAVALLATGARFDLVFSDIVMPGRVSGIELAQTIQKRFPGVRVVLATGYSEYPATLPGIRILAKPYDLTQVMDALQGALRT
jgi:signal transduction histidine kinase